MFNIIVSIGRIDYDTDVLAVSRGLVPLGGNLQHLTHLKIDSAYNGHTLILLVLKSLTRLESIEFGLLQMDDTINFSRDQIAEVEVDNTWFYDKISSINSSHLKSLRLRTYLDGSSGQDVLTKTTCFFNLIVTSCSLLEIFDVNIGQVNASGAIDLDFRSLANLKQVTLNHLNCRCNSFHHDFGKYWKNINTPTMHKTLTLDEAKDTSYHINLAWDANTKKIDIQLQDCKR